MMILSNNGERERERVMKLDDNPQMVAMLDHTKGSIENKIRQAYNNGYNDGFKAGVFEAWDDMRKQLGKSLRQQFEQRSCDTCKNKDIEGWKNPCLGCIGFAFYEPKDEPQTHEICTNTHECVKDTHDKDEPQADFWHSVTREDWLKAHGIGEEE